MEKQTVFFTMVQHPIKGWMRVGKPYPSRAAAKEWLPVVRGSWRGFRAKVAQCTVRFEGGKVSEKSRQILDTKFNMDVEITKSGTDSLAATPAP
ncbi:hypothetical protein SAMN05216178_7012 [Pseudomonas saponiphila]|jgi:hypothetical protein|uniref:Uncharacterized protein n=1 Tax=Pseudomonas saponiphila TaxID=556534 RepID=A0A1H5A700_9PSED|nr:hypothetical protein [Pseudomonas saponiphila]SED38037.1 hypothetical protein SAMN05216178_7012 [Pseudomonas saponiphila]